MLRPDGGRGRHANAGVIVVVAGLRHGDVAAGGLRGFRQARPRPRRGALAGARLAVLRWGGGPVRRRGGLRGQLAVRVPLHGRARQAVLVRRGCHRGAAGPLRRLARVHRPRRHLLHKVRAEEMQRLRFDFTWRRVWQFVLKQLASTPYIQ